MPTISYPVQLHEHLPNIPELVAHKMLREATDILRRPTPNLPLNKAEEKAAEFLIRWHDEAEEELELIRNNGLAAYISGRTTPKVLATLYGLKAKGRTEIGI